MFRIVLLLALAVPSAEILFKDKLNLAAILRAAEWELQLQKRPNRQSINSADPSLNEQADL